MDRHFPSPEHIPSLPPDVLGMQLLAHLVDTGYQPERGSWTRADALATMFHIDVHSARPLVEPFAEAWG